MYDLFDKRIAQATDAYEDDFFSDNAPVGKPTGINVIFLTNSTNVERIIAFLGDDVVETEVHSGQDHSGTFVRFRSNSRTLDEVRGFVATLP